MIYSKTAAEGRRKGRSELKCKVRDLEVWSTFESTTQFMQDYEAVKSKLEGIYNHVTKRIVLRS